MTVRTGRADVLLLALGLAATDTVDVGEGNYSMLVVRDVDAGYTSHSTYSNIWSHYTAKTHSKPLI